MIRYALFGLLVAATAHAEPTSGARLDVCALGQGSDPAKLLDQYADRKYQNSFLDLPGQSAFFDQSSLFRCGDFQFLDGKDKGMYSSDNVLFTTTPDEKSIRVVRVTMALNDHFANLIGFLEKTYGPGKVLRSDVKSKGERKAGEEIRLIETPDRNYYLDIVYIGIPIPAGSLVIVAKGDVEANRKVVDARP